MGNGDGTSLTELLLEDRDNTTIASEYVAKACGDELGDTFYLAFDNGFVEGLAIYFADTL